MSVNNGYLHDDSKNGWNPNDANGINAFSVSQPNLDNGVAKDDVNDGVHDLEQAKRDREPLLFVKWLTNRPGVCFGIGLGTQIFFILLFIALMMAGVDVMPFELGSLPLDIRTDTDYLRSLAWIEKTEDTDVLERFEVRSGISIERSEVTGAMVLLFHQENGNVFSKENLKLMKEVEDHLFSEEEYQSSFCALNYEGRCKKPSSVLRYFDGSMAHPTFNDPEFDDIVNVLNTANTFPGTARDFEQYIGIKSNIDATEAWSDVTKMTLLFGAPLEGYVNATHEEDEQFNKIADYTVDKMYEPMDKYYNDGVGEMGFYYFSTHLISKIIVRQIIFDMMLAMIGLAFLFIVVCVQTRSLWITCWALFSVLSSFFISIIIYRFILDYRYIGVFHALAVFIILGIGADDVFVFFDTWRLSANYKFKSMAHRMSYVYRRASLAMLFTSLTTATAFIVSAASPFIAVSSFGVFAGVLVLINYLFVISFFPAVVLIYHGWFDKFACCCCCTRPTLDDAPRKSAIVRFFAGPYYKLITHWILRFVILGLFVVIVGFFVAFAAQLKVNEEEPQFFKKGSNLGQWIHLIQNAFKSDFFPTQVLLLWGLKEQDLSKCHKTDVTCFGDTVWDEDFNMNSEVAQQQMKDLCHRLKNLNPDMVDKLSVMLNKVTNKPEVQCFIDDMDAFYREEEGGYSVPLSNPDVDRLIASNAGIYDRTALGTDWERQFELAFSYFLFGGFSTAGHIQQFEDYDALVGEARDDPHTQTTEVTVGNGSSEYTYGTKFRYATLVINTTIDSADGYIKVGKIRDAWEDYTQDQVKAMVPALQGGFQTTELAWNEINVQELLVRNALIGVLIGICVAFPILIVATHNIITGIIATMTLIIISTSVMGMITLAGWKLGVLESLNLVLVVGLSVDYVVHLAEGYSRSVQDDRLGRTKDMLEEVGVSVMSGAITTLMSSVAMLFAQIIFFYQFGIFIFCTILFSIVYSLVLFTTFMALLGPQGSFGSLKPIYDAIGRACCKKKQASVDNTVPA